MNKKYLTSTVFKKFVMAVTGLALIGFVITHLLGNLLLYKQDGTAFNEYAFKLASFGALLYAAEIGLLAFFLFHAFTGIRLTFLARSAKPIRPAMSKSKGGGSHWNLSSTNMAWSGTFLLLFLVLHILHFKFGPGIAEGYSVTLAGAAGTPEARDLQRYVVEQFHNPVIAGAYVISMIILGLHLRHGAWSALQSLGLTREGNSAKIYVIGGMLALLLSVGFLFIPITVYFRN